MNGQMQMIKILNNSDAETIRWLQKATVGRNENYPKLEGIFLDEEVCVSTDGFRLHIAKTPMSLDQLEIGATHVINQGYQTHKTKGRYYHVQKCGWEFPDYKSVIDGIEEPRAIVSINRKFLKDLADMPEGESASPAITLEIGHHTQPVMAYTDSNHQAVIMPMHIMSAKIKQVEALHEEMALSLKIKRTLQAQHPDIYDKLFDEATQKYAQDRPVTGKVHK